MAFEAKKEIFASPKAEAKVKTLKTKKSVLKGTHGHKKKIRMSSTFWLKTLRLQRQPKEPRQNVPRRNKLDHCAIIKFPLSKSQP